MAERHGAVCMTSFNEDVNLLVYRPGYERSDKCKMCVETGVTAVSIRWMLDSLLETRQIRTAFHRLTFIPDVARPTAKRADLPHYQHPYFVLRAKEYAIPTSFPQSLINSVEKSSTLPAEGYQGSPSGDVPPVFQVKELSYTVVDVYQSAMETINGAVKPLQDNSEFKEEKRERRGVEITLSEQYRNKVDRMLFSGLTMLVSSTLCKNATAIEVLRCCGATIHRGDATSLPAFQSFTHLVYHHDDKKSDLVIEAAHRKQHECPDLVLCESNWIEDCLLLGELLPACGMYTPSAKLMDTLAKKYTKRKS